MMLENTGGQQYSWILGQFSMYVGGQNKLSILSLAQEELKSSSI